MTILRKYGLRYREGNPRSIQPDADLVFFTVAGHYDRSLLADRTFRGSHVIRDPRDLVVSGYEYHMTTKESWAHRPDPRFDGKSYQDHLRSLSESDGIMAEINWIADATGREMVSWDYRQPEFLELRYEDILADELGSFEKLFHWYEFNERAVQVGLSVVERFSLKNGGARPGHIRSGVPHEWQERFSSEHIAYFKERTGDLLIRLGYEADVDW